MTHASILRPVKLRILLFFPRLHHPNNRLENIFVFYLPVFSSVAKVLFLGEKYIGGALALPCTPQVTPYVSSLLRKCVKGAVSSFQLVYQTTCFFPCKFKERRFYEQQIFNYLFDFFFKIRTFFREGFS
jgi:hypothetical protein